MPVDHFTDRQYRKYKNGMQSGKSIDIICRRCADESNNFENRKLVSMGDLYVTHPEVFPINGAQYYRDFLSLEDQQRIVDICDRNAWKKVIRRRQQFYGEIYYHTRQDEAEIQPADQTSMIPLNPFQWLIDKLENEEWAPKVFGQESFPTQILVNEYIDCTGIASHFEDEDAFGDVIATISLVSPIMMTLVKPMEHNNDCEDLIGFTKVLLEPGSLFIMKEDCRHLWRHGISRRAKLIPLPNGGHLVRDSQYRRISLTIRHLLQGRKRVLKSADE